MHKGSVTLEDARLIHEFAQRMQPILRHNDCNKLLEEAKTVSRIAYCAIAEARQNARAERVRHGHFSDPYTTEIVE